MTDVGGPFRYYFLQYEQPAPEAWIALCAFADEWNQRHRRRFDNPPAELMITLPGGPDDPELGELEEGLSVLEGLHQTTGRKHVGPQPDYAAASLEQAPYFLVVGQGCPSGLLTNEIEAFGSPMSCPRCGAENRLRDRPLIGTLQIDEDLIDPDSGGDPDLLNLHNGGRLVSRRFVDALQAGGATGFRLIPLESTKGDAISERYFLLCASHVVLEPCARHPWRQGGGICCSCGKVTEAPLPKRGLVEINFAMGSFHVPSDDLKGLSLFSRHRFGMSDIYFARDIYRFLQSAGIRKLDPSCGIDTCRHDGLASTESRVIPAQVAIPAKVEEPADDRGLEVFLAHLQDPHPQFLCDDTGEGGPHKTFDVKHLVERGCSPKEFDAIVRKFPDARHLRDLYERANGMLLYCEASRLPRAFPSIAAMQRGPVDDDSFIRFERAEEWHLLRDSLREQMVDMAADLTRPFVAEGGLPFARITNSSDLLVCAGGAIYYFSPGYNRYHNQMIAKSVGGLLARISRDPAGFLMDTASVARFHGPDGEQHVPRTYLSGR